MTDRILHEILLWPHENIILEENNAAGFCDYVLVNSSTRLMTIEAKKSGSSWFIPHDKHARLEYKLNGILVRDKKIDSAIMQVQGYCNHNASEYAVVTNGYSFIIFRALSKTTPWKENTAFVFSSVGSIIKNFVLFYELLAFENLTEGIIETKFHKINTIDRIYDTPISHLSNPDAEYGRNILSSLLQPYIDSFFGDIANQLGDMLFESCYVYSAKTKMVDINLEKAIKNELPHFATTDGFQELKTFIDGDSLAHDFFNFNRTTIDRGAFAILMGGIGCGKSTYIKRFLRKHSDELKTSVVFYYINYIGFSDRVMLMKDFTMRTVAELIKQDKKIIDRKVLEKMYENDLELLKETKLHGLQPDRLQEAIGDYIYTRLSDNHGFCEHSLMVLRNFSILPVIIFDNVDQLPLGTQIDIFNLAQYISKRTACFCILSMREESYCTAKLQKVLTAYVFKRYHISSPKLKTLLSLRFKNAFNGINTEDKTIIIMGKPPALPGDS